MHGAFFLGKEAGMAGVTLRDFQKECLAQLSSGKVLAAGVGAGKSVMSLYWYVSSCCKTRRSSNRRGELFQILDGSPDLVIITTAKKRDSGEWEDELSRFNLSVGDNGKHMGHVHVTVDSWNNIAKYLDTRAVFIFDEQRAVGSGKWAKSFIKIAKRNPWIMLSATPADKWEDWCPIFVADGFHRNRTEFFHRHAVYSRYTTYPRIDRWIDVPYLERCRDRVLVTCVVPRETIPHEEDLFCDYDKRKVKEIMKTRWNPDTDRPFQNASELCFYIRRLVNCDESRVEMAKHVLTEHGRVIIFYSLSRELESIDRLGEIMGVPVYYYNGSVHDGVPDADHWIYAVQYNAGAEGWNCTTCNAMIFWDLPYSYRQLVQAKGRIDRLNTPYTHLYYYMMRSHAPIDLAIVRALKDKKNFNARAFVAKMK